MKKLFLTTGLLFAFVGLAQAELATSTLLKPDNTANLPLKKAAKFTWQKVTGASKYRLIFSNDKSFANYDANKFKCLNAKTCFLYTVASPSYNVAASHAMLKTNGNYFWQVQSVGKTTADNSKMGETRSFVVGNSNKYVKIANDGSELPNTAKLGTGKKDWACTKDNETGLIWEVKTNDDGLRDWKKLYSHEYFLEGYGLPSEAENFVYEINNDNTNGLCGSYDWRLPKDQELKSLVFCSVGERDVATNEGYICKSNNVSQLSTKIPTINPTYFPNTTGTAYWTNTGEPVNTDGCAWGPSWSYSVSFHDSYIGQTYGDDSLAVRLVSGNNQTVTSSQAYCGPPPSILDVSVPKKVVLNKTFNVIAKVEWLYDDSTEVHIVFDGTDDFVMKRSEDDETSFLFQYKPVSIGDVKYEVRIVDIAGNQRDSFEGNFSATKF